MVNAWMLLNLANQYRRILLPIVGLLVVFGAYFEDILGFYHQLGIQNSIPSGRPAMGVPDGLGFKQVKVQVAKKNEPVPQGVTPNVKVVTSGHGRLKVKPSTKPTKERPTREVIKDLRQYL